MFQEREASRDGYRHQCKDCRNVVHREVHAKRKTSDRYMENRRKNQRLYYRRHADRVGAHRLAREHKDSLKSDTCSNCGSTENLHMHHPDYKEPLKVITLCVPCHEAVHHRGVTI